MSTTLLNNLSANDDPVVVSVADALGAGDGPGGSLSVDSETLVVIAGAGSQSLLCNRGASPADHAVGASVDYSSPNAVPDLPGGGLLTVADAPPGSTFVTALYFDSTASTGGLYAWDGAAYQQVGLATS